MLLIFINGCANRAELNPQIKDLIHAEIKNQIGNIDFNAQIQAGLNNNFDFQDMVKWRNEVSTKIGRDSIQNKKNVLNLNVDMGLGKLLEYAHQKQKGKK